MVLQTHHIGWAVRSIEKARMHFQDLGFIEIGVPIIDQKRKVRIAFLKNEQITIEIIEPLCEDSPVTNLLEKSGPSPYHVCFIVSNESPKDLTTQFKEKGFIPVSASESAPAIDGKEVQFFYSKEVGLIEIIYEGMSL